MLEELRRIRREAIRHMLRPLIRFCLGGSHTFPEFIELARSIFVEVAVDELRRTTTKINTSRIAVLTGMDRQAVRRVYEEEAPPAKPEPNLAAQVLARWEQDSRFLTHEKQPRILSFRGEQNEFRELVEAVNKKINSGTVLFELMRIGAVKETRHGLKLVETTYRTHEFSRDFERGFQLLSRDVASLIRVVQENIFESTEVPNLHIHTEYTNIYRENLPVIRTWFQEEGGAFHKRARDFLAQFDRDLNFQPGKEAGARVVLSAFSHTEIDPAD